MFVDQNFNRSFSEFSFNAKQDNAEFKYRSYSTFDFYTNASGWVTKPTFNKVVKKFDGKMKKRNKAGLLLSDNFPGHMLDFFMLCIQTLWKQNANLAPG